MFNIQKSQSQTTAPALANTELSDFEIISDVLFSQKGLINLYSTALCEVSTDTLRAVIEDNFKECAMDQFDSFLFMNSRGMYPTTEAETKKIEEARNKWNKCKTEMCL